LVCRIAKERDRELERDLDGGALGMKAAPILRHSGHHPLRQRGGTRTAVMLAPFARITGGSARRGAAERERARVELRLVP
jgi:hypothetical protein